MKFTNTTYIFLAFIAILGWNAFLTQRDDKLFDAYDKQTAKQEYCKQLKVWHPDCKVE
jgi:hypothetical protein